MVGFCLWLVLRSSWKYRTMGTKRTSYKLGGRGEQLGEVGREWFGIFQKQLRKLEINGEISYQFWKEILFHLEFYS